MCFFNGSVSFWTSIALPDDLTTFHIFPSLNPLWKRQFAAKDTMIYMTLSGRHHYIPDNSLAYEVTVQKPVIPNIFLALPRLSISKILMQPMLHIFLIIQKLNTYSRGGSLKGH